ncbi:MAG: drug/metabolite transporter (DMT)-like permease [Gammaproteobacteria bacterium]|jgi:drug/metabolite transporter (DMT)-like permease
MMSIRTLGERCYANAYLLLCIASLFFAANAIAGRMAAGLVTPVTLTFFRWSIATTVIIFLARKHLRRDIGVLARHWLLVFALGALGFAGFNLFLYGALNYTTAINVSIEQSAIPVTVMLINFIAFRQRIRTLQCLGVLATIAGVVVTVSHGDPWSIIAKGVNRGDAIMIGAVLTYAGYAVALRFKPAVHGLSLMAGMAASSWLFTLPVFSYQVFEQGFVVPGAVGWAIIVYAALLPAIVSQLFFMRSIDLIGSNRAAVFMNLVPIFGAVMAVVVLGESFQTFHLLGLILVLGGLAVAERFAKSA